MRIRFGSWLVAVLCLAVFCVLANFAHSMASAYREFGFPAEKSPLLQSYGPFLFPLVGIAAGVLIILTDWWLWERSTRWAMICGFALLFFVSVAALITPWWLMRLPGT